MLLESFQETMIIKKVICDRPRRKDHKSAKIFLELTLDFEFIMHFEPSQQIWNR